MKTIATILGTIAMVAAGTAFGATVTNDDLLSAFTSDGAAVASVMSAADLDSVRGEGTFEQFFEVPQLRRSFEKTFTFDTTTISVIGVEGIGITLLIDSPFIP